MDSIRSLIHANAHILLPMFETTCFLLGGTMVTVGFFAMYQPHEFAFNFGIPLPASDTTTKPSSGTAKQPDVAGWLIAWAGREIALGSAVLALLYLAELKALSVVMMSAGWVAAGDSLSTALKGRDGAVWKHAIPSLCLLWAGPVGYILVSNV